MVCLFAFLPSIAFVKPGDHGKYFMHLGRTTIWSFVISMICCLTSFVYNCITKTFKNTVRELVISTKQFFGKNKHALMIVGLYLMVLISFFNSGKSDMTLKGSELYPEGLFLYTVLTILFVFSLCIRHENYKKTVVAVYIINFIFVSLVMIQQYYGILGSGNAQYCPQWAKGLYNFYDKIGIRAGRLYLGETGTFYNLNHMGYYIAMCSMLCTALFLKARKKGAQISLAFLTAYSYWALVVNNTFGAFLAVSITILIFAFVLWKKNGYKKIKPFVPIAIFVAVCVGVSLIPYKNSKNIVIGNFMTLSEDTKNIAEGNEKAEDAGSGRWPLWVTTIDIIKEKPLLGFGPNNAGVEYSKRGQTLSRAHCEIIEIAANTGIPSAMFYIMAICLVILKGIQRKSLLSEKDATLAPLMAVVSYSLSALVGVFLFYTACHYFIFMGLISDSEDEL